MHQTADTVYEISIPITSIKSYKESAMENMQPGFENVGRRMAMAIKQT